MYIIFIYIIMSVCLTRQYTHRAHIYSLVCAHAHKAAVAPLSI